MPAGKRRTRVTIQQPTEAAATDGQLVPSWSTYCSRWAEVIHVRGNEQFTDRQSKATVSAVIRLRSDPETRAITPRMRVVVGSRQLYVQRAYDVEERNVEVELECEERVG